MSNVTRDSSLSDRYTFDIALFNVRSNSLVASGVSFSELSLAQAWIKHLRAPADTSIDKCTMVHYSIFKNKMDPSTPTTSLSELMKYQAHPIDFGTVNML